MLGDPSRLRQSLRRLEERRQRVIDSLLGERGPIIRGALKERHHSCGRPGCRCADGEKHLAYVLARPEDGRSRQIYVRAADADIVRTETGRYRSFRAHRAELVRLEGEIRDVIDQLCEALQRPYVSPSPPKQE